MLTVRETVAFLPKAEYRLSYNGQGHMFDPDSDFHMAAYGDFNVARVEDFYSEGHDKLSFELVIACKPIKNGVPV